MYVAFTLSAAVQLGQNLCLAFSHRKTLRDCLCRTCTEDLCICTAITVKLPQLYTQLQPSIAYTHQHAAPRKLQLYAALVRLETYLALHKQRWTIVNETKGTVSVSQP